MSGRITSSMLTSDYLRNTKRNLNSMRSLQNQLSTGNQIQRVSDNPYKASRIMQVNTEISYNKQYNENIKDTSNWLDTTDTALAQMGNVFGRIETLLVSAGNAAFGPDERIAVQDEIKEKVNELSQILNTNFDGSYIFGGTKTDSKPTAVVNGVLQYADKAGNGITTTATGRSIDLSSNPIGTAPKQVTKIDMNNNVITMTIEDSTVPSTPTTSTVSINITTEVNATTTLKSLFTSKLTTAGVTDANGAAFSAYNALDQINSDLQVDISQGIKSVYNKNAIDVLEFTDKNGSYINVSDLMKNIITDLGPTGNKANITSSHLRDIQAVTQNLLKQRSEVGSLQNRMESAQANNETENYNMTDILSKTEDIDWAETTMNYSVLQTVYTASLQTSAKILPQTILNYL
jgi:flagellar hook-associated protein 3 FlgL